MLYRLAHILRDRMPWLWDAMGWVLSWLFFCRYRRRLGAVPDMVAKYVCPNGGGEALVVRPLTDGRVGALARMLAEQPEEAFTYFRPHGFGERDLRKLVADHGFLAFVVMTGGQVVGYFFQRSFFWGKAYRGYITDYRWRRKGINRMMNECATEISEFLGLQVYGTIAPENIASLKSAEAANTVRIIRTLHNGDYFVQYLPPSEGSTH